MEFMGVVVSPDGKKIFCAGLQRESNNPIMPYTVRFWTCLNPTAGKLVHVFPVDRK